MPKEEVQRGFRIRGRVQGVFLRAWTREVAAELGLRGTVRNRTDGSVEAHARGRADDVDAFEKRLWDGSPAARVEVVEGFESTEPLPEAGFRILR